MEEQACPERVPVALEGSGAGLPGSLLGSEAGAREAGQGRTRPQRRGLARREPPRAWGRGLETSCGTRGATLGLSTADPSRSYSTRPLRPLVEECETPTSVRSDPSLRPAPVHVSTEGLGRLQGPELGQASLRAREGGGDNSTPRDRQTSPPKHPLSCHCSLSLCYILRCVLDPSEPGARFWKPSALPTPEQSRSASPGRSWVGALPSPPAPGSQEAATFAPWGLGSPSLCQQLPSTWGGAVPRLSPQHSSCPLPGRDYSNPFLLSGRSQVPRARSGASHLEETP